MPSALASLGVGGAAAAAPFDPTSIAGLTGWWKADALALADGDPIVTWTDSCSTPHDATNATSSKRPTFKTAIQNGLPVARFDGVDDYLKTGAFTVSQPITVFTVLSGGSASWFGSTRLYWTNGLPGIQMYAGTVLNLTGPNTTAFRQVSSVFNGASSQSWVNAASLGSGDAGSGGSSGVLIGSGDEVSVWSGDIGEILMYNSVLSTTNRQAVEGYLKAKWGTP